LSSGTCGILLMAFGAPDSDQAIGPFMANLLGGRQPSAELVERVKERYRLIGGKSPLLEITRQQASALERLLNDACEGNYRVYVGMGYWHPYIGETITHMAADGISQVVAVSLSPHYTRVSTGAYIRALERAVAEIESPLEIILAGSLHHHPLFIEALAEKVAAGLARFPGHREVKVVFTAHSLPVNYIETGDPYVEELNQTVRALAARTGLTDWRLAYQSKGGGQGAWLEPQVEDVLENLAASGHKEVLLVPVGFATDHVETLYDLDIGIQKHADSLGLHLERAEALNTSPTFIAALADLCRHGRHALEKDAVGG